MQSQGVRRVTSKLNVQSCWSWARAKASKSELLESARLPHEPSVVPQDRSTEGTSLKSACTAQTSQHIAREFLSEPT